MDLYGREYVCDHIAARLRKEAEEKRLNQYITEALRILTENTMHYLVPGVGAVNYGSYLTAKWGEQQKPEDTRTGDEIAADIILAAGLSFREGGDENS